MPEWSICSPALRRRTPHRPRVRRNQLHLPAKNETSTVCRARARLGRQARRVLFRRIVCANPSLIPEGELAGCPALRTRCCTCWRATSSIESLGIPAMDLAKRFDEMYKRVYVCAVSRRYKRSPDSRAAICRAGLALCRATSPAAALLAARCWLPLLVSLFTGCAK